MSKIPLIQSADPTTSRNDCGYYSRLCLSWLEKQRWPVGQPSGIPQEDLVWCRQSIP